MDETLSVVIADDDEGHAVLVRRNMKRAGLDAVVHLHDGQEVLDYLYRRGAFLARPRHTALAVVLDLNMPRLGGIAVLEQLKTDGAFGRIPVFVLTTTDNPHEIERCYTLGASACLVKPTDFGAFGEMIQRFAAFLMTAKLPGEDTTARPAHE
jgi:CheY-like chemotaxis protein